MPAEKNETKRNPVSHMYSADIARCETPQILPDVTYYVECNMWTDPIPVNST